MTPADLDRLEALARAAQRASRSKSYKPQICDECGKYPADLPSKLCAGCEAYREHTGAM